MKISKELLTFSCILFGILFFLAGTSASDIKIPALGNRDNGGNRVVNGTNVDSGKVAVPVGFSTGSGKKGQVVGGAVNGQPSGRFNGKGEYVPSTSGSLMGNSSRYLNIATVEREGIDTGSNAVESEGADSLDRQKTNSDVTEVTGDVEEVAESQHNHKLQEKESELVDGDHLDGSSGEEQAEQEEYEEEYREDELQEAVIESEEIEKDQSVTEEEEAAAVEETEEDQAENTGEENQRDEATDNTHEDITRQTENTAREGPVKEEKVENSNGDDRKISGFQMRAQRIWNRINVFHIFEKPVSDATTVNYFRNEMQNEFTFRNGLYFSCTSAYLYNKHVDTTKYAYMMLPGTTMIIVVTANKLFFQDLMYSSNRYLSIKNKFAYLINTIIDNLKGKKFFRNYNYQYLFRSDPFAFDPTKKLLDFDLLGELSGATQTIYTDIYGDKKVSMHKVYGGWFQFLGIVAVNGYYYKETIKPEPIEVVPFSLVPNFIKLVNMNETESPEYSNVLGLWRDFPGGMFVPWRYSLELLLWDSLNILPNQLPHPAKFVLAYVKTAGKTENRKGQLESGLGNDKNDSVVYKRHYTLEELRKWPTLVEKIVKEHEGIDVAIVAADDYNRQMSTGHTEPRSIIEDAEKKRTRTAGYVLLLLLNSEFFDDKALQNGSSYQAAKRNNFFRKIVAIIDVLQDVLKRIRDAIEPEVDPDVKFYNFLDKKEESYKVFNPHVLGSIAGITQHLKCENAKHYNCTHDVSMHFKYGGWFEFGGAIFIKNTIPADIKYEKHEIVKKEYEHSILLQANGSYQAAGLWRDIPEKDTSRYRYSLQTFILENPRLNIVNMQKAHPFMIIDLISKGLRMVKHTTVNANDENYESANFEDEYKKNGETTARKKDAVDTIETEEEAADVEQKLKEIEDEPSLKSSEFNLNFGEDMDDTTALKSAEYGNKSDGEEGALGDANDSEIDEESDEIVVLGNECSNNYEKESELCEDGEITGCDEETDATQMSQESTEGTTESFADSLKNAIGVSASEMREGSGLSDIENAYDNTANDHDLNLLDADEEDSGSLQRNIILTLLIVCLTIAVSCAILAAFKLYERFTNRKAADKNDLVLAFKDKDEIPIVHGMPAPWLKA